jgi:hypothetical protein
MSQITFVGHGYKGSKKDKKNEMHEEVSSRQPTFERRSVRRKCKVQVEKSIKK